MKTHFSNHFNCAVIMKDGIEVYKAHTHTHRDIERLGEDIKTVQKTPNVL